MSENILKILNPFFLSIEIASFSTLISLIAGILLAWIMAGRKNVLSVVIELLIAMPLFLPPTVMGFYLLLNFGRLGILGRIIYNITGNSIIFTPAAAVMASSLAALPIIYKAMKGFMESTDKEIINAAKIDGANSFQILFFINLPLAKNGMLAGIMLSFLRALGEFGITLMVAGNIPGRTQTMSLAIYDAIVNGEILKANYFAVILMLISIIIISAVYFVDSRIYSTER